MPVDSLAPRQSGHVTMMGSLRVGLRFREARLNWNSPKHFLSHPRHLHQKRWRGRDTHLCCAATNEGRDATQEAVPECSRSVRTGAATLSKATQGGEEDLEMIRRGSEGAQWAKLKNYINFWRRIFRALRFLVRTRRPDAAHGLENLGEGRTIAPGLTQSVK